MKNNYQTQLFIIDTQSQLYIFLLKSSLLQTVHNYRYTEKHIYTISINILLELRCQFCVMDGGGIVVVVVIITIITIIIIKMDSIKTLFSYDSLMFFR